MKLKKLVAFALCGAMALSFAGCGSGKDDSAKGGKEGKKYKVGILQFAEFTALQKACDGFKDELKEQGLDVDYNYQCAAADTANCPTIADTLVNDGSDLILTIATPAASAVKEKTMDIPVLFTAVTDPADSDLVESNDAPGANLTGTSDMNPIEAQIDLLLQVLPDSKKVAVMYCSSESNSVTQYEKAKEVLEGKNIEVVQKTISEIAEAKSAVESLKGQVDAIYIPTDNTIADGMTSVSEAANACKLPVICGESGMVESGGLMTYGIDYYELGKQTGKMAAKILADGEKPETMPVEYQTDTNILQITVNQTTADEIGVTIPQEVLDKATVVK